MNRWRWIIVVGAALTAHAALQARPAHKQAAAQYFGPSLAKKLNDCRLCHLPDPPGAKADEDADKPHNVFGARLKAVRDELRKAGKSSTLEARLDAMLGEDSDGDGASNLDEILAGRFPGDRDDQITVAERAQQKSRLTEFNKLRHSYPWRPFETVRRPPVAAVKNAAWVRNPIDAFIAAEHEALGLTPRAPASPAVLLRRVYLDLIGLPPTPAELHAFLEECASAKPHAADTAYRKVVDRLLDDPRHGERWGRHWMDIWRYSDWAGYGAQVRDSQPHIWRWRDWIIESLNADKGYDRMVLEMLAGDELAPEDPKALAGTGYLVRNWKLLSREKWMQDTVEHTSMAFLGLTLGCAKCHDHMYDPILQKEYYEFRAIFEPHDVRTDRLPGQADVKTDGLPRVFDKNLTAQTFLFIRGDDRAPDKARPLAPGVPDVLGGAFKVETVKLPASAVSPDRAFAAAQLAAVAEKEIAQYQQARIAVHKEQAAAVLQVLHAQPWAGAVNGYPALKTLRSTEMRMLDLPLAEAKRAALLAALRAEKLEDAGQKDSEGWKQAAQEASQAERRLAVVEAQRKVAGFRLALVVNDKTQTPEQRQKLLAAAQKELAKAQTAAQKPPTTSFTRRQGPSYPDTSTGRRLALARWLASTDNPLTARVAVNHLWARHFGQGIVPSTFDFGKNGRPPSHPALLDWLAAELMERGWSMKAVHKLIVTSNTYRMASTPDVASAALDRDNKYLWRFPSRRLEAEAVRDAVFYVAGKLDPKMGGPEIDYPLGLTVPRRSLYFRHAAEKEMEFLSIFDAASVNECYERKHSIVPQQALALLNSELTLKHARILARNLAGKTSSDSSAFAAAAFEHVLARPASAAELAECVTFLAEQTQRLQASKLPGATGVTPDGALPASDPALRARENLVHVLLNHHEFVTIR